MESDPLQKVTAVLLSSLLLPGCAKSADEARANAEQVSVQAKPPTSGRDPLEANSQSQEPFMQVQASGVESDIPRVTTADEMARMEERWAEESPPAESIPGVPQGPRLTPGRVREMILWAADNVRNLKDLRAPRIGDGLGLRLHDTGDRFERAWGTTDAGWNYSVLLETRSPEVRLLSFELGPVFRGSLSPHSACTLPVADLNQSLAARKFDASEPITLMDGTLQDHFHDKNGLLVLLQAYPRGEDGLSNYDCVGRVIIELANRGD